ncbi:Uncharacterised protein [Vibrio cholerae]|nr:Uncharacterised protein [Vibrio cholerae]
MANHIAFHHFQFFWQGIALTAREHQLAISFHCPQATTQPFILLFAF